MSEETSEELAPIGILQLIGNMLSPRTLPHIIMIAVISSILLLMVGANEQFVAMSFISMAISYVIVAILSNISIIQKITKLPEEKNNSSAILRFIYSFRITFTPILLAVVILGCLWSLTGGNENSWISPVLASLFIVWSIAQAASFRAGIVEWLANGLGDAKLHTYKEKISTVSQVVVVQSFAIIVIWVGQVISEAEQMSFQDAILGGFLFVLASIALQGLTLWLTRDERETSGSEKGMAAFSFKWMIIAQIFITWHAFSIYRRVWMDPSDTSTIIEEGLLMAFTVIFAVWSLTTYTVRDGKRLVSENASLPLAIAFGYAYAGSVTMLTGTFDNLKEVMIFGHVLSMFAMVLLMRPTLRVSRISSEMFTVAKNVDISKSENNDSEEENNTKDGEDTENNDPSKDEEWQEDGEIDWDKGIDISEGTNWDEDNSDVEIAESD